MADTLLKKLQSAFTSKTPDIAACNKLLSQFKIALLDLPIHSSIDLTSKSVKENLETARCGFEVGVFLSLKQNDLKAFERNFAQLRPFYFDYGSALSESKSRWSILGLHLLGLLSARKTAEFHTELELLPLDAHANEFIAFPIALERELMEGSYRSLWDASANLPCPEYSVFVDHLVTAARNSIAGCIEIAYLTLTVNDATSLLKIKSNSELQKFCEKRGWEMKGNAVNFRAGDEKNFEIPAHNLIKQTLEYASELERIV